MKIIIDFIENIGDKFGITDAILGIILIIAGIVFLCTRFFNFWFQREMEKEKQQFELINRFVDEDGYFEKVKSQPYYIKQVLFRRLYWLRSFSPHEVNFILEQETLDFSIYDLKDLKSAKIIKFSTEQQEYQYIENWENNHWKNHLGRTSAIVLVGFVISSLIISIIYIITKSMAIFIFFLFFLMAVEIRILSKHDAMKIYLRYEEQTQS